MVNTHMACGALVDDLMVRVGKDDHEAALSRGAREMEFTGRPLRGMVVVPGESLADEETLQTWVETAVTFARSEPPKPPKPPRPPKPPKPQSAPKPPKAAKPTH